MCAVLCVSFLTARTVLAAPLPPAKSGGPIVLPAELVQQINAASIEARQRHRRNVDLGLAQQGLVSEMELYPQNIVRRMLNSHVMLLQTSLWRIVPEAELIAQGLANPGSTEPTVPLTQAQQQSIRQAIRVYQHRLERTQKTGGWSWDDLDVPTKALPKE
jgi:hypothetical protein